MKTSFAATGVLFLFLAAGCASSAPKQRMISVEVFEASQNRGPISAVGPHLYQVRIHNVSDQPIAIESIHLELAGNSDLDMTDNRQTFTEVLEFGETRDFDMWVTVLLSRGTSASYLTSITSLEVAISCRAEGGYFTDSDVHNVQRAIN
jgi:hypothetical protein